MRHTLIEAATIEPLFREALPLATDEEIAVLVSRCEGRLLHEDNDDLLRSFGRRDTSDSKIQRVGMLIGCLTCGSRNAWFGSAVSHTLTSLVKRAAARTAPAEPA
ncbi:hypothetical protein ASG63_16335 [Methylobacterium sp. Leaf94]|uniref:hypothetical protein n=1 Tax=Methylobacterium sp. Leaf94 TaxID=1736250 RepID=UPI0006F8E0F9|nr:hypothetical protein [Methylobacterium sp. Leaf94]KQU31066.1 hypothetical protein ASG63_16335 [Methylobacterium sp. Leaf94]